MFNPVIVLYKYIHTCKFVFENEDPQIYSKEKFHPLVFNNIKDLSQILCLFRLSPQSISPTFATHKHVALNHFFKKQMNIYNVFDTLVLLIELLTHVVNR